MRLLEAKGKPSVWMAKTRGCPGDALNYTTLISTDTQHRVSVVMSASEDYRAVARQATAPGAAIEGACIQPPPVTRVAEREC